MGSMHPYKHRVLDIQGVIRYLGGVSIPYRQRFHDIPEVELSAQEK
jgi:hypothetical protein